jgi:hypothetical protein
MITNLAIEKWMAWIERAISLSSNDTLNGIPIQLRDSEQAKTYPGIYLVELSANRIEVGGVKDSNAYIIDVETKLVTTPGDDDEDASSQSSHSDLLDALSPHILNPGAASWMSASPLTCFDVLPSAPITTEEDGYRVTTWTVSLTVC